MAKKLNKTVSEMEVLKSYTDSLNHLTKLEKKLNTLRRESSSKIHSLNAKNLNFRSVYVKSHLKDLSNHKIKRDFIQIKHDNYILMNKTSKKCNSASENNKLLSNESDVDYTKRNYLNNNYDIFMNNKVSNISDTDKTITWNTENDIYYSTDLVEHLNNVCHKLINQNSQDEKLLSTYLNIVLSIREKAVISSTKQKLSRLKIKGDNTVDQLSSLRKKQRALLMKLQHEYNEIKFMKSFQKRLFEERKKVLLQQLRHFKTISGINSRNKISSSSFNFKNYMSVSNEKSSKSPIKCYDVAFNFKKNNDLFEKRIVLRSHKKTLNDLLSLYFDLQLNTIALYTINQNNSSSQIIGMLKEISQKTISNNCKPDSVQNISSIQKNLESNITASHIENHKSDENVLGITSLRNSIVYEFNEKQSHCKSKAASLNASKLNSCMIPKFVANDKSKRREIETHSEEIIEKIIPKSDVTIDILNSANEVSFEPVISELPLRNNASNGNFAQLNNVCVMDPKRKEFDVKLFHKNKHNFNKEHFFSNRINKSLDINSRVYFMNSFEDVHLANLTNFNKFSLPFMTYRSIENSFSKMVNFQKTVINRDIVNLLRKFHMFTKIFLQGKQYEFSHEIRAIINSENESIPTLKELFREKSNNDLNSNKSIIQVLNFSLDDLSKIVNIMARVCMNVNFQTSNDINHKFNYFHINVKENLMLDSIDLTCLITENVDKIELGTTHGYQTCKIYNIGMNDYDFGIFKISNVNNSSATYSEHCKMYQSNNIRNVLQKSASAISENFPISSKSKQSDTLFSDDCYQKILEIQSGRKVSFGKQFSPDVPINGKSRNQDVSVEKEVLEQNVHNKLLPYTTLPISISKSLNQLEEAEELRKKQLAVEMEIKALLEQQTSQFSYFLGREIPDKPPPPYIPPESKVDFSNIQLPKSETAFRNEQVTEIVKICYDNIWQSFLTNVYSVDCDTKRILNEQYVLFKKANSISNSFVFDLCNELFSLKYRNVTKTTHLWEYKKQLKHSKSDVCKSIETLAMQYLGYGNNLWKDNIFINCAHKIQDHVDELLIKELQDEETEWVNIEEYEMSIKNNVTESILNGLLKNTIQEYVELSKN